MPVPLPEVSGTRVVRALDREGFKLVRVVGHHHVLRHSDGRMTTVPVRPGRDLAKGTMRGVLAGVGLTAADLERLLHAWRKALKPIPQMFDWYKDNSVAGTLLIAGYLIIKGYVIARGDLSTALGILQYAGLASVVVAGLLSSLPILAALMFGWTVFRTFRALVQSSVPEGQAEFGPGLRLQLATVMAGAFAVAFFFTPWPYLAAAAVFGLIGGVFEGWRPRRRGLVRAALALLAGYAVISMLYTAWLPHVVVSFRPIATSAHQTRIPAKRVGYVLEDDPDGWLIILTSGQHTIARFRDSSVRSIDVCQRVSHGGVTDISYAPTLWAAATDGLGPMNYLRPGHYLSCPVVPGG
jgi:predicted RNA binding protein YcfA (HicA-like mRNA interferase family)